MFSRFFDLRGKTETDSEYTGYMDGGKYPYKDASGYKLDNQALVFKVQMPKGVHPSK